MSEDTTPKPSFSPGRKWGIGLNLFVRTVAVMAVVVMANYLGSHYFKRSYLSSQTRAELSPLTINMLKSLTNEVKITLYYDKKDPFYPSISALLNEYRNMNPRIHVTTVDYRWDIPAAQKIKSTYKLGQAAEENDKNLVIFDADGKSKIVNGNELAQYTIEQIPGESDHEYRRKPTAFLGEKMFNSALLYISNPKPFKAYFLGGHGEHRIESGDDVSGYMKFAAMLQQNYVECDTISLLGTNVVPADCNLLIIAGPSMAIPDIELEKIGQYLSQGGRLFALFNSNGTERRTGLEKLLNQWGVGVADSPITDPAHSLKGTDIAVAAFSRHSVVNPLIGSTIDMIKPRPISRLASNDRSADAAKVEVIAASEETATLIDDPAGKPQRFPLAVIVEKGAVKGVITERGSTRMIVVGDSYFLCNGWIDVLANRDFAGYVANWLLDRTQLMEGLGPKPVTEFRLNMTSSQLQTAAWILLAAQPGAWLLLGGLVWLKRRK